MRITFSVYDGKFLLHKDSLQCMTYGCHYFDARSFAFWQERKSYVHDYCLKEKYLSYLIFLGPGVGVINELANSTFSYMYLWIFCKRAGCIAVF